MSSTPIPVRHGTVRRARAHAERIAGCSRLATPLADLLVRLWVARVFWKAGLSKFQSWETTLLLFENEYRVPLLPPATAAALGTFVELVFPVLLALGLFHRGAALVLFVFNIVAVVSYPELMAAGREQHLVWGILLLVSLSHGPGPWSLDHLIARALARPSSARKPS